MFSAWSDDGLTPATRSILDAGCGTGVHLEALSTHGRVEGLDRSADMLAVARERHPELVLHQGDFRDFELSSRYDVICSLFGSLGYLPDRAALRAGIARLGAHLRPGGRLLIEPPIVADAFQPPQPQHLEATLDGRRLVRAGSARVDGRNLEITFDWHHHAPTGGEGSRVLECHRVLLLPAAEWLDDMTRALPEGTRVSFDPAGPMGRGLFNARLSPGDGPGTD